MLELLEKIVKLNILLNKINTIKSNTNNIGLEDNRKKKQYKLSRIFTMF